MLQLRRARRSAVAGAVLVALTASATAIFSGGGTANAEPTPVEPPAKRPALTRGDSGKIAKDGYIVVFKDGKVKPAEVAAEAKSLTKTFGGTLRHTYSKTLRGYAAKMTAAQAKALAKHPDVALVEPDRYVTKLDVGNDDAWGIDRIDQQWLPLNRSFTAPNTATNVHAYIIDSGIRISHEQFEGRAAYGIDAVTLGFEGEPGGNRDGDAVADDCDGHGTHVAGTVGGEDFGVAKGVQLVAVQVLDCGGGGYASEIVAGIEWVTANAQKPAVANMSLGGGANTLIDNAVAASIASGITYAVAAGNGDTAGNPVSACNVSPARVPTAITVSASDEADFRLSWAGIGPCVDIFAPGNDIKSAYIGSDDSFTWLTGTSMASPHVAGAAALLLSANPALTPAQVRDSLVNNATRGAVRGASGTTDRLLRVGTGLSPVTGIKALANGKVVTTPSAGASPLIASSGVVNTWEQFEVINNADGTISFKAKSNGKFVSAESAGTKPLLASRTAIGAWEKFELISNSDGTVSFRSLANSKFVSADSAGTKALIAKQAAIGTWEKFSWASPVSVISLFAMANFNIVSADSKGTKPLIASRPAVGAWEKFDLIDLGNGNVALRAQANGKYVTAESAGALPLIASRTAVGTWQTFKLAHGGNGSVALKAGINGKWVSAESAGTKPLIASRPGVGDWESFFYVAF